MREKARILIVDDEKRIVNTVRKYLENDGYEALVAYDGAAALETWKREQPDLVVLDILMPKLDGLGFCREVRKKSTTPIIVLSAKSSEFDKLQGLDLGADDYVTKPFSPRELVSRVHAVLRRVDAQQATDERPIVEGPLVIDKVKHKVELLDVVVPLTATEFGILQFLASQPGCVFSRERLLEAVERDSGDTYDGTIYSHIKNVRKKLARITDDWSFIETVHGAGYRFNAKEEAQHG